VVIKMVAGVCKVIGFHVASCNRSVQYRPTKKARHDSSATASSFNLGDHHGHKAYFFICQVARVPDLVQFLLNNGLNE